MSGYFVTGTDTGVGKTSISVALIRKLIQAGYKVAAMKPVASGCRQSEHGLRNEDAELLISEASIVAPYEIVNPYAFEPKIAPHLAARDVGIKIELETIRDKYEVLAGLADLVVVEGVGGWRVPLGKVINTEHMAKAINLPIILVVGMRLGCLNHALLTVQAIESSAMVLAGWVANLLDPEMDQVEANIDTLRNHIAAPLLGQIPFLGNIQAGQFESYLDLSGLRKT